MPWLVLGLWVGVLAIVGPFAAKLSEVQHDRITDYLPANADSTQVARIQDQLPGGETTQLVLVYHRDGGLTPTDKVTAAEQVDRIAGAHVLTAAPKGVPSADGATLMYPVSSNEPGTDEKKRDALVHDVREVAHSDGGLSVEVGGPGALATDAAEVYDSLGGPLLYTTVAVVAVLLILIYRSPVLWLLPLVVAGIADYLSMGVAYGLNHAFGTTVSGQSSAIMTILVFGAGTDYALLLVSRYREELRHVERPYDAMAAALRGCGPAVLASSGTVAVGVLCLLAADLNSSRSMGPLGTVGVLCALVAMLTLLPAILVLLGRRVFWPLVPAYGSTPKVRRLSLFAAMGSSAGRRPLVVLAGGAVLLGVLALGVLNLPGPVKEEDAFVKKPEAVTAMQTLARAYPDQGTQPITVITPAGQADRTLTTIRATDGVGDAQKGRTGKGSTGAGWTEIDVFAKDAPQSAAETATIERLRTELKGSYVGGPSAQQIDLVDTNARDVWVVVPIVLLSVLLILIALLRSLVAPLMLVVAVIAVWGASLGIGGLVFGPLFGFEGTDPGLGLLSFVFLVALGVDYGIFLMHRMREEALRGAEPVAAALTALRTTGGVIASAGLVLAATFAVLTNMGLVQLVELGFVIAVGVLLDTFLVRTYLVTSASVALGRRVWWPGALSRGSDPDAVRPERQPETV
ncbi:MMPL family transporter [Streptomyces sp. NBC_01390]|uniref:MMPL family transporter n=1 Tax=Streptomyces sp. NBC_01390 TaxID=2903850 RepID=UPI003244A287